MVGSLMLPCAISNAMGWEWGGLTAAGGPGNDFRSRAVQTLTFVDCNPLLLMLSGGGGGTTGGLNASCRIDSMDSGAATGGMAGTAIRALRALDPDRNSCVARGSCNRLRVHALSSVRTDLRAPAAL